MTLRNSLATGLVIAAATATIPGAIAQTAASSGGEAVYEFLKATENRVWRLNKQTGEIAVCTLEAGEALVCSTSVGAAETPATTYEELQQRRGAEAAERQAADAEERARAFEMLDRMMNLFREYAEEAPATAPAEQ